MQGVCFRSENGRPGERNAMMLCAVELSICFFRGWGTEGQCSQCSEISPAPLSYELVVMAVFVSSILLVGVSLHSTHPAVGTMDAERKVSSAKNPELSKVQRENGM